jgi:hypothetical protein
VQLGTAMHQSKASVETATIRSGYEKAIEVAKHAEDPRLRRSVAVESRFVLSGGHTTYDGYALARCTQIERTFPEPFLPPVVRFGFHSQPLR